MIVQVDTDVFLFLPLVLGDLPLQITAVIAVAKLSKALAWLSSVRSRERPEL